MSFLASMEALTCSISYDDNTGYRDDNLGTRTFI